MPQKYCIGVCVVSKNLLNLPNWVMNLPKLAMNIFLMFFGGRKRFFFAVLKKNVLSEKKVVSLQ